jgi:D-glycero-D-manno-heptose 1,7-bisphosphate phosphatase
MPVPASRSIPVPRRPAVFLDRDGVLVRNRIRGGRPYSARSLDEFRILRGATSALRALRAAGYLLLVVTNQPEIARGLLQRGVLRAMHARLRRELPLDGIHVCLHDDADRCACRKPKPGMLLAAARDWNVDLARSFLVGDRWKDVAAGQAAGCRTVYVDGGYDEAVRPPPDARAMNAFKPDIVAAPPPLARQVAGLSAGLRRDGVRTPVLVHRTPVPAPPRGRRGGFQCRVGLLRHVAGVASHGAGPA